MKRELELKENNFLMLHFTEFNILRRKKRDKFSFRIFFYCLMMFQYNSHGKMDLFCDKK